MIPMHCDFCTMSTGGLHENGCINNPVGLIKDHGSGKWVPRPALREVRQEVRQGWVCPKCSCVYAPHISECNRCNNHAQVPERERL